jgi:hypothetical protein
MNKKYVYIILFYLICAVCASAQFRAFNDIFPNLSKEERSEVFSDESFVKTNTKKSGFDIIGANTVGIDPAIIKKVLDIDPGYLVESISIIPGKPEDVTLLDIYNALGKIRDLKGKLYSSHTRKQLVPLFEEATRITSEKNTTSIPDPPTSSSIPPEETVFLKLKDVNFGNSYYRTEAKLFKNGLCYTLTNFRSLTYLFVPIIKEGNFIALLYLEPVKEGVLIYGFAGINISDFFASKIDVHSAISKRLGVITAWAAEGIQK